MSEYQFTKSYKCLSFFLLLVAFSYMSPSWAGDTLSANDRKRYDYFFQEAARRQAAGHYTEAFDLYEHARDINPKAAEVYFYESMYYQQMKQDSLSQVTLLQAIALEPANLTFRERMAQYYVGNQQYDKAIEAYEAIFAQNHDNTDALYILLRLYQQRKQYPKMLETLNRLEVEEGESEKFALDKMHIYELMNEPKAAYKELKSLVEAHPLDMIYKTMLGNWLMEHNRQKEAYKLYTNVLSEEPDNSYAQMSLYDYYNATNQTEQAHEMLDRILLGKKTDEETKAMMLRAFIQDNENHGADSTKVIALFDKMLALPHPSADVAELRAAYMSIKKMPIDTLNAAYRKVLDIAPDRSEARVQLIQNLWSQKDYDGVIAMSKAAHAYNPEEMVFYYFGGMAHYLKHEEDATLDEFRRGVAQINSKSSPDLVSDLYMIMGDILHSKNRQAEAFAAYDSCLQWKPDNYPGLNNYAYYVSQTGKNLQKAELMSYKTIKAEPKNGTFLDTYAWILFMEERYAEAKTYIDQALACRDSTQDNSTVIEHAGDIYAMNGLIDKAVEYWKQAQKGNDDADAVAIKIRLRKYMTENEIDKYKKKWKKTK